MYSACHNYLFSLLFQRLATSFGLDRPLSGQYYNTKMKRQLWQKEYIFNFILILYFPHNGMFSIKNNIITVSLCNPYSFCLLFPLILSILVPVAGYYIFWCQLLGIIYFGASCWVLYILVPVAGYYIFWCQLLGIIYFGASCWVLYISLNQTTAFVFRNFSLVVFVVVVNSCLLTL